MIVVTEGSTSYVNSKQKLKAPLESFFVLPKTFSQAELLSKEALVNHLESNYGCSGYIIVENNSRAKVVAQKGLFTEGGVLYVGPEYVAYGYIDGQRSLYFINDRNAKMQCSFVDLSPRTVPSTIFSQLTGMLPLAVAWSSGCVIEYYGAEYLNASTYSINSSGQVTQAYGLVGGTLGIDFIPSTKFGGIVSVLSKARAGQLAISLSEDQGVVPARSATQRIIQSIREGSNIDLSWVKRYNRPISKASTSLASLFLVGGFDSSNYELGSDVQLLYKNSNNLIGSRLAEYYNALIEQENGTLRLSPSLCNDLYFAPSASAMLAFSSLYEIEKARLEREQARLILTMARDFSSTLRERMSQLNLSFFNPDPNSKDESSDSFSPLETYSIPVTAETLAEAREGLREFQEKYGPLADFIRDAEDSAKSSLILNDERFSAFAGSLQRKAQAVASQVSDLRDFYKGVGLNAGFMNHILASGESLTSESPEYVSDLSVAAVDVATRIQSQYESWLNRAGFEGTTSKMHVDKPCEFAWDHDLFTYKDGATSCYNFRDFLTKIQNTREAVEGSEYFTWEDTYNGYTSWKCSSFQVFNSSVKGYDLKSQVTWIPLKFQHSLIPTNLMSSLGAAFLKAAAFKTLGDDITINIDLVRCHRLAESVDYCMSGDRYYGGAGPYCGPSPKGQPGGSFNNVMSWAFSWLYDPHHKDRICVPGYEYSFEVTIHKRFEFLEPIDGQSLAFEEMYTHSSELVSAALSKFTAEWLKSHVGTPDRIEICSYDSVGQISDISSSSIVNSIDLSSEIIASFLNAFNRVEIPSEVNLDVKEQKLNLQTSLSEKNEGAAQLAMSKKNDKAWYGVTPPIEGVSDPSLFVAQMELI